MKMIRLLKYLVLIVTIVFGTQTKNAMAFGFIPPLPPDVVSGVPAYPGQIMAKVQSVMDKVQMVKNIDAGELLSQAGGAAVVDLTSKATSIGAGAGGAWLDDKITDAEKKIVGPSGRLEENKDLDLDEYETNEGKLKEVFFTKLFFVYPNPESMKDFDPAVLKSMHKSKIKEFQQDIFVNTYLTGRYNEDFLVIVDKTLKRLELCASNIKADGKTSYSDKADYEKNCKFFGLQMQYIPSEEKCRENEEECNEDTEGNRGIARNLYIVSTVADRVLRILEDLTAVEGQFRAARHMNDIEPLDVWGSSSEDEEENHSDASDYIDASFKFAYNEVKTHTNAQMLAKEYNREEFCKSNPGKKGCPLVNKDGIKSLMNVDDTAILTQLIDAEKAVEKALVFHNYKNSMPYYKTQYRNYLQAIKNHENALKTLKDSDECNINFINKHNGDDKDIADARKAWGPSTGSANEHDKRTGLSRRLIETYQNYITDKILQETQETEEEKIEKQCNELGFYKENECPNGYTQNKGEVCKLSKEDNGSDDENNIEDVVIQGFYECVMNTVTTDVSAMQDTYLNEDGVLKDDKPADLKLEDHDINEYMQNDEDLDNLNKESIIQNEQVWHIGSDMMMQLAKDKELVFNPWNDQKDFQTEYMFNKYRNILSIVKSVDKGSKAMEIIVKDIENQSETASDETQLKLEKIIDALSVLSYDDAMKYMESKADVSKTSKVNPGRGLFRVHYNDGSTKLITQTSDSDTAIKNPNVTLARFQSLLGGTLPTTNELLKYYINERLYGKNFTKRTHDDKNRRVATDLLNNVISTRNAQNNEIAKVVNNFKTKINNLNNRLEQRKKAISKHNENLDKEIKGKNEAQDNIKSAKNRIVAINTLINEYTKRKGTSKTSAEAKALDIKIALAETERDYLNGGKDAFPPKELNSVEKTLISSLLDENSNYIYVPIKTSEAKKKKHDDEAKRIKVYIDVIKKEIEKINDDIKETKSDFAEEYIKVQEEAQDAIEEENSKYEAFLYNKETQMIREKNKKKGIKEAKYSSNNLATTIKTIIENKGENDELKEVVEAHLKEHMKSLGIMKALKAMGITSGVVFPAGVLPGLDIGGSATLDQIEKGIIGQVAESAAEKITEEVNNADAKINNSIETATKAIKSLTDVYGLTPSEDGKKNETDIKNHEKDILLPENYGNEGVITQAHIKMIEELRKLDSDFDGKLLGVPNEDNFIKGEKYKPDEKYFVGLPARSRVNVNDSNASRDYLLPKAPMLALPPLREVFYFGPTEYEDIPFVEDAKNNKNGHPVISSLLLPKEYNEKWELLPEIWRYLLATPNFRSDDDYQHTFVERDFPLKGMQDVDDQLFRTEIARGGVFPCKIGSTVIDVLASENTKPHKNIKFVKNNKKSSVNLPTCKEVELSGNKVIHKLADEKSDKENNNKETLANKDVKEGTDLSELSQFIFIKDKTAKKVNIFGFTLDINIPNRTEKHYRRFHEELWKRYLDDENTDASNNNITHQKIQTAIFNRNIFGDFLNNVSTEIEAKKIKDEYEHTVTETIKGLCQQLCEVMDENKKPNICPTPDENGNVDYTSCANTVMKEGLASSPDDKKYGFGGQYGKNSDYDGLNENDKSWYVQFINNFDTEKDVALKEAESAYNKFNSMPQKIKENVKDRLHALKNSIDRLKADKNEVVPLDSVNIEDDEYNIEKEKKTAQSNIKREFEAADEGVEAMKNQGKTAAYCPVY